MVATLLTAACLATPGCKRETPAPLPAESEARSASPDRLKAGEHLVSEESAFGIPVPKGLHVTNRYSKAVYMSGKAKAADLTDYFRTHVLTDHLEIAGMQTVFPRVYLKGDASKRLYRIEISALGSEYAKVMIRDITPPPLTPGLSEQERWEQVGMNPDGTLKDRLQLK